jgi:hypothetical protein
VNIARKGWLEAQDIINCMNLEQMKAFLTKAKGRRARGEGRRVRVERTVSGFRY